MTDRDTRDAFPPPARSRRWRVPGLVLIALVVLAAGAYGVHSWRYWSRHVSTDDAFVEGHVSPVSARVRGTVLEVLVRDNQEVAAGAPLARLDPRDLEVKVHQARAALATAAGRLSMATEGVPLTDESTRSLVDARGGDGGRRRARHRQRAARRSRSGAAGFVRAGPRSRPRRPTSRPVWRTSSARGSIIGACGSCSIAG